MTIVMTGGGSGGHITPILAVADELKRIDASVKLIYIGQRGDRLGDVVAANAYIDQVFTVRAGKFRRYHGEGWRQLLDLPTQAKNARDFFRTLVGVYESVRLMRRLKPDVIFTRGGFVSVPVAFGGHLTGVPYITHDSDSIPSLANRIIARWASLHAVALPPEAYPYPKDRTIMVGIPVSSNYTLVTDRLLKHYRQLLKLEDYEQVICITGGGNGARSLNRIMANNAAYLLKRFPKLALLHIAGRDLEVETRQLYETLLTPEERSRVHLEGFVTDLYRYSGAADVVVARGGATNLAEFAIQGKACLLIPSPQLVWNINNSRIMQDEGAIMQLTEDQAEQEQRVARVLSDLLSDNSEREKLGSRLAAFGHPDSAKELASLLLDKAHLNYKQSDAQT